MKRQAATVKQILLLLMVGILLMTLGYSLARATVQTGSLSAPMIKPSDQTQLGFYDILAEKQEIYDLQIKDTASNNYIVSLTMPEDQRFILRGKIAVVLGNNVDYSHLDFTPVYYHNPQPNRMVNSFVDYTTHHDFLIRNLNTKERQLIVARSGMLVLMPEIFTAPNSRSL
jgi:hypothetical protein